MKHKRTLAYIFLIALFGLADFGKGYAQSTTSQSQQQPGVAIANDELAGFNETLVRQRAASKGLTAYETGKYVERAKQNYIQKNYYNDQYVSRRDMIASQSGYRMGPMNPTPQEPCTNMDFETGTFTGWTGSIGDNTVSSNGPLQNIVPGIASTTVDAAISDCGARHTIMTP